MSWVRIHDAALTHPKIVGLIDKAFRLWVWGLCYCQQHLTDGVIPAAAVPAASTRTAAVLVLARLWDALEEGGWRVHDYLDWNDSKAFVTKKRSEAKDRMANARHRTIGEVRENFYVDVGSVSGSSVLEKRFGEKPLKDPGRDPFIDPVVTERAGRFIERYESFYVKHRHGARYALKPARDYQAAVQLCETWPDDRLDKLAVIFLTTDHKFAEEGSRTVTQFLALASWCDSRLAAHEAAKGIAKGQS